MSETETEPLFSEDEPDTGEVSGVVLGPEAPAPRRSRRKKAAPAQDGDDAPKTTRTAARRPTAKADKAVAEIKSDLTQGVAKLAAVVSPVLPTTSGVLVSEGTDGIDGLVELAKDNPDMLAGLAVAAKAVPFLSLGKLLAAIAFALMVDFHRAAPDSVAARGLGVTKAWVATHPQEAEESGVYLADPAPVSEFARL
jgi:hypothetical protein